MGKKLGFTSIFSKLIVAGHDSPSPSPSSSSPPPWPWPSCGKNPPTISCRHDNADDDRPCSTTATRGDSCRASSAAARRRMSGAAGGEMYKTVNSVFFDDRSLSPAIDGYSCFSFDDDDCDDDDLRVVDGDSFSTTTTSEEWSEAVIRSLSQKSSTTGGRFFFDPSPPTMVKSPSKSVAVAVETADPYGEFRASMEEMVAAHGIGQSWDAMEELLVCYLRVNADHHHPIIVAAFLDLLSAISKPTPTTSPSPATTTTTSSGRSTSTTACDVTTTSATTSAMEPCRCDCGGGGSNLASCSSSAAGDDLEEEEDEEEDKKKASDDELIRRITLASTTLEIISS
uniref:Transcription repressor n=1 Tax=Leersia perrieri TaxID=77586 RepID=A0A0D9XP82_9ORYZ